ncbi:hypothetical protein ACLOJK_028529, partial [Asimina triloba]
AQIAQLDFDHPRQIENPFRSAPSSAPFTSTSINDSNASNHDPEARRTIDDEMQQRLQIGSEHTTSGNSLQSSESMAKPHQRLGLAMPRQQPIGTRIEHDRSNKQLDGNEPAARITIQQQAASNRVFSSEWQIGIENRAAIMALPTPTSHDSNPTSETQSQWKS